MLPPLDEASREDRNSVNGQTGELAIYNAVIRSQVPDVIIAVSDAGSRGALAMLYGFVKVRRRLPQPNEVFYGKRMGALVTRLRMLEAKGTLIAEQRVALDAIPLWRSTATQPRALASPVAVATHPSAPPAKQEKEPLLPPPYKP